jgi:hypothetical protein
MSLQIRKLYLSFLPYPPFKNPLNLTLYFEWQPSAYINASSFSVCEEVDYGTV